jgi:hypothetical protein
MMRYIQRDKDGNVVGHFSHWHEYAQEEVSDDHPDILAWRDKKLAAKAAYMEEKALLREMLESFRKTKGSK